MLFVLRRRADVKRQSGWCFLKIKFWQEKLSCRLPRRVQPDELPKTWRLYSLCETSFQSSFRHFVFDRHSGTCCSRAIFLGRAPDRGREVRISGFHQAEAGYPCLCSSSISCREHHPSVTGRPGPPVLQRCCDPLAIACLINLRRVPLRQFFTLFSLL